MKILVVFSFLISFCLNISALEAKNPISLCERFISPDAKKSCENKIKDLGPDWYLSSICEKQFDDNLLFSCLELSKKNDFSPLSLRACDDAKLTDQMRMSCLLKLTEVAANGANAFQKSTRRPASLKLAP